MENAHVHPEQDSLACRPGGRGRRPPAGSAAGAGSGTTTEALQKEIDRLKLENDRRDQQLRELEVDGKIQAERVKEITALGLPKFDGTAKLENGAGAMELTLLTGVALQQAVTKIDGVVAGDLIVASGEALPRGDIAALKDGQTRLTNGLKSVTETAECKAVAGGGPQLSASSVGLAPAIAAVSALAGMFRADVTYTGLTTTGIDATLLADMLAVSKKGRRRNTPLPPVAAPTGPTVGIQTAQAGVERERAAVAQLRARLEGIAADRRKPHDIACLATATAGIQAAERYDAVWMTPGTDGDTRYLKTLRFLSLLEGSTGIVQVNVQSGGTAVNSKNIGTFFGVDPLRLHGQIVVTWIRYGLTGSEVVPSTLLGGLIACASRRLSMTEIYPFTRNQPSSARPDVECRKL